MSYKDVFDTKEGPYIVSVRRGRSKYYAHIIEGTIDVYTNYRRADTPIKPSEIAAYLGEDFVIDSVYNPRYKEVLTVGDKTGHGVIKAFVWEADDLFVKTNTTCQPVEFVSNLMITTEDGHSIYRHGNYWAVTFRANHARIRQTECTGKVSGAEGVHFFFMQEAAEEFAAKTLAKKRNIESNKPVFFKDGNYAGTVKAGSVCRDRKDQYSLTLDIEQFKGQAIVKLRAFDVLTCRELAEKESLVPGQELSGELIEAWIDSYWEGRDAFKRCGTWTITNEYQGKDLMCLLRSNGSDMNAWIRVKGFKKFREEFEAINIHFLRLKEKLEFEQKDTQEDLKVLQKGTTIPISLFQEWVLYCGCSPRFIDLAVECWRVYALVYTKGKGTECLVTDDNGHYTSMPVKGFAEFKRKFEKKPITEHNGLKIGDLVEAIATKVQYRIESFKDVNGTVVANVRSVRTKLPFDYVTYDLAKVTPKEPKLPQTYNSFQIGDVVITSTGGALYNIEQWENLTTPSVHAVLAGRHNKNDKRSVAVGTLTKIKPILKTRDGIKKYVGDKCWVIANGKARPWTLIGVDIYPNTDKYFHSKEEAYGELAAEKTRARGITDGQAIFCKDKYVGTVKQIEYDVAVSGEVKLWISQDTFFALGDVQTIEELQAKLPFKEGDPLLEKQSALLYRGIFRELDYSIAEGKFRLRTASGAYGKYKTFATIKGLYVVPSAIATKHGITVGTFIYDLETAKCLGRCQEVGWDRGDILITTEQASCRLSDIGIASRVLEAKGITVGSNFTFEGDSYTYTVEEIHISPESGDIFLQHGHVMHPLTEITVTSKDEAILGTGTVRVKVTKSCKLPFKGKGLVADKTVFRLPSGVCITTTDDGLLVSEGNIIYLVDPFQMRQLKYKAGMRPTDPRGKMFSDVDKAVSYYKSLQDAAK